jgi:hypothetical protein
VTAVGWTFVAVSVIGLVGVFGWLLKARFTPLPSLSSRGEEAEVPEERDDEMAVARCVGVTVPDVDGSHESLPEDKETDAVFWALAKTAGIGADR